MNILLVLLFIGAVAMALSWRRSLLKSVTRGEVAETEREMLAVRLDFLARHINEAFIVLDEDFRLIDVNQQAVQMYGWTRDELVGMKARDLRAPETMANLEKDLNSPPGTPVITIHQRKDGTKFSVEASLTRFELKGRRYIAGLIRDLSERKQLESVLRNSDAQFRSLFDNMNEGVAFHSLVRDRAGGVVNYLVIDVNSRYSAILGLEYGMVINRLATEVYGTDEPPFLDTYAKTALTGVPSEMDVYFEPMRRHFHVSVAPWGIDGFATIFSDITLKKRTETALQESERRFRGALETARAAALQLDRRGRVTFANDSLLKILGYSVEEVIGADWGEKFVPPDIRDYLRDIFVVAMKSGQLAESVPNPIEGRVITKSGGIRVIRWSFSVNSHTDGTALGVSGFGEDITEQKKAEEALRESEERFRRIFDESSMGIVIVDLNGNFVRTNRAFQSFVGYTGEELNRMVYTDVTHPDHRERDMREVARVLAGEIPRYVTDKRYLRKDGSETWGHLTVSLMQNTDGTPGYFLSLIDDISGQHRQDSR